MTSTLSLKSAGLGTNHGSMNGVSHPTDMGSRKAGLQVATTVNVSSATLRSKTCLAVYVSRYRSSSMVARSTSTEVRTLIAGSAGGVVTVAHSGSTGRPRRNRHD